MKTIEQKAKDFDKTLTKARKYYEETPNNVYKAMLENLFPELAESEDEKIRKYLIDCVTRTIPEADAFKEISKEQILVWLEKQEGCEYIKKDWLEHIKQSWYKEGFIDGKYNGGTSKEWTINDAATLKELIDFLENGTAKLQHDLTRYANWLKIQFTPIEKQGEKTKPIEGFDTEFERQISHLIASAIDREHEYNEGFVKYVAQLLLGYAKNELKPTEWSEEDELHIRELESLVKQVWTIAEHENDKDNMRKMSDLSFFLKTLRPQLKQEWSEEDEIKIKSIIAFLKSPSLCAMDGNKGIIDENIKYLKSLKDRVQPQPKQEWKQENREELTEFENAMMHIGSSFFGENAGLDPNDTDAIKEQAELLLELAPKTEWSEEDESMYTRTLGILGKCYMGKLPTKVEEELKWFKLLKQIYTWKPSIEQMEVLWCATEKYLESDNANVVELRGKVLESLYNELKKLKGE